MPSHVSLDLDWRSIRPLNGSKADAFEELCTQLARAECPPDSQFIRKGRPDSGVEAHVILPDSTEWAWQSKYFDTMKSTQWTQLDESVRTALNGHPKLTRFVACISLDLPDGRTGASKTARQRWNDHVTKWTGWAARAGMHVEFVWQGNHELLVELAKPQHLGLVNFFFGTRHLDDGWFRARLAEAHKAASARYTPELNIDLAINEHFGALGRTGEFLDGVRRLARPIKDRLRSHAFALTKDPDTDLQSKLMAAQSACDDVLDKFKSLSDDPVRTEPLEGLRATLSEAVHRTGELLAEYQRQREATKPKHGKAGAGAAVRHDESDQSHMLRELRANLRSALSHIEEFQAFVSSALVIMTGDAGSGKTHLLCDLAKQRLDKNRPTIVLMGQRFLETSDPWVQTLQQLDLAGWSAKELVDALEVVARRANSKVLFIIDAINEGAGKRLWPAHLSSFLERLKASAWISTVISVRSSYADSLLPNSVSEAAVWLDHPGFEGVAFDATRAFFEHFGIDLPSTPLLAPEFSNPLYLKTLCRGLQASGQRRLPRGFHGVVAAFELYIASINEEAARDLDYDMRRNRVSDALNAVAARMVQSRQPWLSYDDTEAVVNAQLPGRDYSRSLMSRLFGEGLLIEEQVWSSAADAFVSAVQIGYERLSDYLCVKSLLDQHLCTESPSKTFEAGGVLNLDAMRTIWARPGLHEALHILVAERTGQELVDLLPGLSELRFTPRIFLNSIVWRDPAAVTPKAMAHLRSLKASNTEDVVDTLVTLATIPDHPLNADFTDCLLRETGMAERDAWWTIGLHKHWGRQRAVDRLIQWAKHVWPHTEIEQESARLAAYAIAWLLPSSNRYLRDHATKALVSVLTWRPAVICDLIERFCDVDDAYVVERVLAAVLGASMRTSDRTGIQAVAQRTHAAVFACGRPRPHLLLRDYARGIIKRAEYLLGVQGASSWPGTNPPYTSDWPAIPTEAELDARIPTWSADRSKKLDWSQHRIRSSVMDDDFGRYVIGTNSWTTNWLSLRLDEPQWVSFDKQVERAVSMLDEVERAGWDLFRKMVQDFHTAKYRGLLERRAGASAPEREPAQLPSAIEQNLGKARDLLLTHLGPKRAIIFEPLIDEMVDRSAAQYPPKFDLHVVQRYVLGRVFELGWTSERFGQFDQHLESSGRDADKPERIGKKYQWIAYQEMLAYLADHYQHVPDTGSPEAGVAYKGTWQEDVRDIDPSCVVQPPEHDEDIVPSPQAFWSPAGVRDWHGGTPAQSWARIVDDIPHPSELLFSRDEPSRSDWVNLHTHLKWLMPRPAYEDSLRDGRREVWLHADGALVPRCHASKLLSGNIARKIADRGIHDGALRQIFLGEIGWSDASKFFEDPYYAHLGWAGDVHDAEIGAIAITQGYTRERGGFDCSVASGSVALRIPTTSMLDLLEAKWSGISATYVNAAGIVVAFDPSANMPGPSALLVRRENLRALLRAHDLVLCWAVQGEKTDAAGAPHWGIHARRSFHGLFIWDGDTTLGAYDFGEVESSSPRNR